MPKSESSKKKQGSVSEPSVSVAKFLRKVTPTPTIQNNLSDDEKIATITRHFEAILETLGLDLSNDSLERSPHRIAKMYVTEIFKGLKDENFPKITVIENKMKYDQMVVVRDVTIMSTCEHHFVTIHGTATIAYIPAKKVIGLSKINPHRRFLFAASSSSRAFN